MSQAHLHSPVDETDYLPGKESAAAKHALVGGETARIDVACDGTRLTLENEDTGLTIV